MTILHMADTHAALDVHPEIFLGADGKPVFRRAGGYALLADAIDRRASEVRLVPRPGGALSVVLRTAAGEDAEVHSLPAHVRPSLYERFAAMAAGGGDRGSAFPVRHGDRGKFAVRISWDGDYRSGMVLRIADR